MRNKYPVDPFDRGADNYDGSVTSATEFPHLGYEDVLNEVVELADVRSGMTVLDLGTGTGNLAQKLEDLDCKVWGIDFSSKMLDQARQKLKTAVLVQADLLGDWPPEIQRPFDRIISSYALHHFDLKAKHGLLCRVSQRFLMQHGLIVIGDISFPTARDREVARRALGKAWEEEECYWAADETSESFVEVSLQTEYVQVSTYGGVYVVKQV